MKRFAKTGSARLERLLEGTGSPRGETDKVSPREFRYASPVLKLLTAPVTNDRGPRYMERAFAAIHQANRQDEAITLIYASTEGRVGLFLRFADSVEELVIGPIAANYPNCALSTVERFDDAPTEWRT